MFSIILHKTERIAWIAIHVTRGRMGTLCQENSSHSKWRFVGWIFSPCNCVLSTACSAIFLTYVPIKHVRRQKFVLKCWDFPYHRCTEKYIIKLEKVHRLWCYYTKVKNKHIFEVFYEENDLPIRSSQEQCRKTLDMLYQSMAWGSILAAQFWGLSPLIYPPLLE